MKRFISQLIMLSVLGVFPAVPVLADVQWSHEQLSKKFEAAEVTFAPHLQALWYAHLQSSPTIVMALNKLEEKSGKKLKDKEKTAWRTRFFRGLLQATAFGASSVVGNAAPMIGAAAVNSATAPDQLKYHLEAIDSVDLIQLAKQVEDEQVELLSHYLKLRDAIGMEKTMKQQLEAVQGFGAQLPQTDAAKVAQYFSLHQLSARRVAQAEAKVNDARSALILMSNRDVVLDVENQIRTESEERAQSVPSISPISQ